MKKNKEKVKEYIEKVIEEIVSITPVIQIYAIKFEEERENEKGGEFAVAYNPNEFYAEFFIYKKVFEQVPKEGLTKGFRDYIKLGLAHEVGHCYLWELEGTKRDIEKVATLIGFLIAQILDYKEETKK